MLAPASHDFLTFLGFCWDCRVFSLLPLKQLINATVQKASGFGHEYMNIHIAFHFLCSVVTQGVSEAGIMSSKPVGYF